MMRKNWSSVIGVCLAVGMLIIGCGDDSSEVPTGGTSTLAGVLESMNTSAIILGAVPGVLVTLVGTNRDGETFELETVTDASGAFIFEGLTGGYYKLVFTYAGEDGNEIEGAVTIKIPDGARVDVTVSLGAGGSVSVVAQESEAELVTVYNCNADGVRRQRKITREIYEADPGAYSLKPVNCQPPAPVNVVTNLDQSQLTSGGGGAYAVGGAWIEAQTFTCGLSGKLVYAKVDITIDPFGFSTNDIIVQVTTAPGGDPNGGVVLGAATVTHGAVGAGLETATFSPVVPLTAGTKYAIVVSSPASGIDAYRWIWNAGANPYTAGQLFSTGGGGAFSGANGDAIFETYMEVPAP